MAEISVCPYLAECERLSARWANSAAALSEAVGIIQDLTGHANPIAQDEDGFVAVGYTLTVGAVHRALVWLQHVGADN